MDTMIFFEKLASLNDGSFGANIAKDIDIAANLKLASMMEKDAGLPDAIANIAKLVKSKKINGMTAAKMTNELSSVKDQFKKVVSGRPAPVLAPTAPTVQEIAARGGKGLQTVRIGPRFERPKGIDPTYNIERLKKEMVQGA